MPILEIDSVNLSYGINKILSDIYLKVQTGEVVGFLGRNGCGKTTLLKVIFGVLKGESQSVRMDGKYLRLYLLRSQYLFPVNSRQELQDLGYIS